MVHRAQPPAPHTPHTDNQRASIVVLASGGGTNFQALLKAHNAPGYGARVTALVTDNPTAGAIAIAREHGIATAVVSPRDFTDRAEWNDALTQTVAAFSPDYVLSAGFMRILGPTFLAAFPHRVLNTHPALLPAFPGAHGVADALAYGVKITGCTLHVVDEGTDTGPIIAQASVPVLPRDTEDELHERIKHEERFLVVEWMSRIGRHGLRVDGRSVTLGDGY